MAVDIKIKKGIKILFKKILIPTYNKCMGKFIKESCKLTFNEKGDRIAVRIHKTKLYDYEMLYGIGFIYNIFKYDGRSVTRAQFELDIPNLKLLLLGTYFHESAHLIFTDMKGAEKIRKLPSMTHDGATIDEGRVRALCFNLFNILEDISIERSMAYRYRSSKERRGAIDDKSIGSILRANRTFVITPGANDYSDDNNLFSLYSFLLSKLSLRGAFTHSNRFFDDHPENKEYVDKFLMEPDATKRIDIVIEYFTWLMSTNIEIPEGTGDDINPIPSPSGAGTGKAPSKAPKKSMSGGGTTSDFDDEEDSSTPNEEDGEEETAPPLDPVDNDLPEDIFGELNDDELDWDLHGLVPMQEICKEVQLDAIKKIEDEVSHLAEELVYYFQMLIEKSKPSFIENIQNGSVLNHNAIIKGERLNIFKELIDRSKANTSGIVLLCDNSGSMCGIKSVLLQKAVISMSMMMSKLRIDNAVYAFSDSYGDTPFYTFELKKFEDDYEDARVKNTFNMLSTNTVNHVDAEVSDFGAGTFNGNEDAYHIEYVSRILEKKDFDNKIVIIFSDGMPSRAHLITTVLRRHEPKIKYIGVGLVDSSVRRFYTNHKIFSSEKDLEALPEWLGSLLLSIVTSGV